MKNEEIFSLLSDKLNSNMIYIFYESSSHEILFNDFDDALSDLQNIYFDIT